MADVKRSFADPRVLQGAISYYRDISAGDGLGRIPVRGLVVGARPTSPLRSSSLPHGSFSTLPARWPHRERPEPFQKRLLAFLADLPD